MMETLKKEMDTAQLANLSKAINANNSLLLPNLSAFKEILPHNRFLVKIIPIVNSLIMVLISIFSLYQRNKADSP